MESSCIYCCPGPCNGNHSAVPVRPLLTRQNPSTQNVLAAPSSHLSPLKNTKSVLIHAKELRIYSKGIEANIFFREVISSKLSV